WERQRIADHVFHTPADQIQRFVILPAIRHQHLPLTQSQVVIDDPQRIRQIADMLNKSVETSLNHPRTRWTASVEMITHDGSYYFEVNAAEPGDTNGTFATAFTNRDARSWNLGYVRVNGLDT